MERQVEIFVAVNCFVIGISHLFQAGAWVEFFKMLRNQGRAGAMANGFLSLTFGSLIVSFHWVWDGFIPTVVTILGVAQVVKSLIIFGLPAISLESLQSPRVEKPISYQLGGAVFVLLAAAILYRLWSMG